MSIAHAISSPSNGNSYVYDTNGNMTTRNADGKSFTFAYDAENRLVSVSGDSTATFVFNGDGQRVKSIMDGETTLFVGGHYEITNPGAGQTVTKYYMAGASRVAQRKNGTVSYMLADHLGSTSLVTDANGDRTSELRYKPWGETRFSFGTMPTKYTFTGQFSYTDDPPTPGSEGFGLMYFNARWLDPQLGRFAQADTVIPSGAQGYDRYAYTNNNPVRYTDPTGHDVKSNCDYYAEDSLECLNYLMENSSNPGIYDPDDPEDEDKFKNVLWKELNIDEYNLFQNPDGTYDWDKMAQYLYLGQLAENTARLLYKDDPAGDQNAFQHTYWSALLAQEFGAEFAKKATDVHELSLPNGRKDAYKDSLNNQIGIAIGASLNQPGVNRATLAVMVMFAVADGETYKLVNGDLQHTGTSQ